MRLAKPRRDRIGATLTSQRHENVRKEMKIWLDAVIRIYEDTDPARGEASETRNLNRLDKRSNSGGIFIGF